MSEESNFKFVGLGTVAFDKPAGSDFIMVTPSETLAPQSGRMNETGKSYDVKSTDAHGTPSTENVSSVNQVKAQWLAMSEGNRNTAPDVQEGETVRLWRYGNLNEYFWQTYAREPSLRRLETVLYCYSNLSAKGAAYDKLSSYWHEINTKVGGKYMRWQTTQSDGEAFSYTMDLDPGNSQAGIRDNVGNEIVINSGETRVTIVNEAGTIVQIQNGEILIQGDNIRMVGSESIAIEAPSVSITGDVVAISGAISMAASSGGENVSMTGDFSIQGNIGMQGTIALDGTMTATGNVNAPNID